MKVTKIIKLVCGITLLNNKHNVKLRLMSCRIKKRKGSNSQQEI